MLLLTKINLPILTKAEVEVDIWKRIRLNSARVTKELKKKNKYGKIQV